MKAFLLFILLFSAVAQSAENCQQFNGPDETYSRFVQLAFEPMIEKGKITGYMVKNIKKNEQIEALACITKSIESGNWKSACTIKYFYLNGNEQLGIPKDDELFAKYEQICSRRG
ncbi:MAG: hypothetical protein OQL27_03030 [Sedimenticola sp.]|nr:hypothetical protein [Sedimenticola sp.]